LKTYAVTINGGTAAEIADEKTMVRMTALLARGDSATDKVTTTNMNTFLNKYAGSGVASVSEASTDVIQVTFSSTGNIYEINANTGAMIGSEPDVEITYTITYNANGGSGGPGTQTATAGEATTLSSTVPTRTGYTFEGWATTPDATIEEYSAGGSYTGTGDITLYAVWSINSYTLTLNANGGTFSSGSTTNAITQTYGTIVTLPVESASPTRNGYSFLGWATTSNATTATYAAGDSYTITANRTLHAVWQSTSTGSGYTITYNANGGTFTESTTMTVKDTTGTIITTIPTRSGYSFSCWSTSRISGNFGIETQYNPGDSIALTGNITLYAIWISGDISTAKLPIINYTKVALIPIKWTSMILGF